MRIPFFRVITTAFLLTAITGFALAHPKTSSSRKSAHASMKRVSGTHRRLWHLGLHRGAPAAMPTERATQIQTALIKQGYLTGEPTGTWDSQTVAAMQKLQADSGWQTKITPDSRALIRLGLGPKDTDPGAVSEKGAAATGAAAVSAVSATGVVQPQDTAQTRRQ